MRPQLVVLALSRIIPSPVGQIRKHFDAVRLQSLADSLKRSGVREPVIVRPHESTQGHYRIVAGERRWRAAQLAGLSEIPCLVDEGLDDPKQRLLAQAEENLQREDLNAVEEAAVLVQLMEAAGAAARRAFDTASRDSGSPEVMPFRSGAAVSARERGRGQRFRAPSAAASADSTWWYNPVSPQRSAALSTTTPGEIRVARL